MCGHRLGKSRDVTLARKAAAARGGAGRRRDNDGAGLGLALVAEHVRLHGGSVWVESGPDGSGSTFVIELPAEDLGDDS